MKRENYISRDEYFMGIALLSAQRSKDPSTQVGACIVNSDKRIVGIGYNGFPIGISDDALPWDKNDDNFLENRNTYVVHAEANAILNSTKELKKCSLYCTFLPCNECAKLIVQSGITEVVYLLEKSDRDFQIASRKILNLAGVHIRKYEENIDLHLHYQH